MLNYPKEEAAQLGKLLNGYPSKSFSEGDSIFDVGDTPSHGFFIREGIVKTSTIDSTGVERPVVFDMQGEFFPIGWLMGFHDQTQYYYSAFTPVVATKLTREDLEQIMLQSSQATYDFCKTLTRRFIATQMRIEALEQSRASDKLVYTLRFLCQRFGSPVGKDGNCIQFTITQQELANFVGLTRETTAIELKKLQSQGTIRYDRSLYTVYLDKIEDIIESLR